MAMHNIEKAMHYLNQRLSGLDHRTPIPFEEFLQVLAARPHVVMRNVFQVFDDMIKAYVEEGIDEYPDDPESIHYVSYD